jgi:hypothetical protein
MARVVDRLLAQLPGLQAEPIYSHSNTTRSSAVVGSASDSPRLHVSTQSEIIGVWIRVVLGLSLGMMLPNWPYSTTCGFPLFAYFIVLLTVIVAGLWSAAAAWRVRTGLAHVVALLLVLYGMSLAAAELLPRTGYAAEPAAWACEEELT